MSKLDYDAPPWGPVESIAGNGGRVPAILGEPLEPLERVVLAGEDGPVPGRIHFQPGHRPALHVRLAGAGQGNLVLPWQGYRACRWADFAALAGDGAPLAEPDRWHRTPAAMREALEELEPPAAPGESPAGPLSVRCDVCGAPVGADCRDGTGAAIGPHAWRVGRAAELEELEEPPAALEPTEDLAHPCESCGARPGESCTTSTGNETGPHAARRALGEAAREAARLEDLEEPGEDLEEPGEDLEEPGEDLEEPPA